MFGLVKPPIPKQVLIARPRVLGQLDVAGLVPVGVVITSPSVASTVSAVPSNFMSWLFGGKVIPVTVTLTNPGRQPIDFTLNFMWSEKPDPQDPSTQTSKDMGQDAPSVHLEPLESKTLTIELPLQTSGWQTMQMEIEAFTYLKGQTDWTQNQIVYFTVVPG